MASSYWTLAEMERLRVDLVAESQCFLFLWVGNTAGLEQGRLLMKHWGFRRCEDIVWAKTNKRVWGREGEGMEANSRRRHVN